MIMPAFLARSTRLFINKVRYNHIEVSLVETSFRRYFKSKFNLPTPSRAYLSPNVFREVKQAVTTAIKRAMAGNQAKRGRRRKYDASLKLDYRAAIRQYAAVACPLGSSQSLDS